MDVLKDGAESVKDEVVKRMRSPFVGAFVIAWCVVNYEFLIVVFSEGNYADKIGYIARHLTYGANLPHSIGWPLFLAALSTAALPVVNALTDVWRNLVDVGASYLKYFAEMGRLLPDLELRELARKRKHECESMRRYAKNLLSQHNKGAARLFMLGQTNARDMRKLEGLQGRHVALISNTMRALEEVGLPVQGYRMLQLLLDEGMLSEARLLSDTKVLLTSDDPGSFVLGTLHGMQFVKLIWEEAAEPSYEISPAGRLLLAAIEEWYSELFTFRSQPNQ